jgi:two-component system, OmpR family, phosphate regulon response regulator OmpR
MAEAAHILVIDDDARLRTLLKNFLTGHGFRVTAAASAMAAREMMHGLAFDALVLDVMMPGESGLAFLKALRSTKADVPVLMLSARSDAQDRIAGLAQGSDDYLAKPFEPQELLLRLGSLLRRSAAPALAVEEIVFGPFTFNLALGELRRGDEVVRLTSGEKDMLRKLAKADGQAVSRDALSAGGGVDATRKVDVQINRLRQKIELDPSAPRFLQTLRGQGYALVMAHV